MNAKQINQIRRFWKPKGRRNAAQERELRALFSSLGIRETSISCVLYCAKHAKHHSKLIAKLRTR